MTTLTTHNLTLRPLQDADTEALVRGLGNYSVARWTGRVPHPYGTADATAFLAHCRALPSDALVLAITRAGELIGVIGVEQRELGYWLAETAWGRGYGREAARALADHVFSGLNVEKMVASYHLGNEASRRILLGLGFLEIGQSAAFSKARQAEVPHMKLCLTREGWAEARERRR